VKTERGVEIEIGGGDFIRVVEICRATPRAMRNIVRLLFIQLNFNLDELSGMGNQ